jgi:hypothetical protein
MWIREIGLGIAIDLFVGLSFPAWRKSDLVLRIFVTPRPFFEQTAIDELVYAAYVKCSGCE